MSLNRGEPHFGQSIICSPWVDDRIKPTVFGQSKECRVINIDLERIKQVRRDIPFRKDTLETYQALPVRRS
ncbi:hypothetical protein MIH18_10755 [Marinobacter sp. M3C]|jgi:nitrilase|uniref:hypothetical protein n=1 Tax=unclassified Marinobacter TaxID=83889 RepID=UPI00200EAD1A|nr:MULTISPECIES: hypothetical protein [unclassified Marinobacter]MCL1477188.1 hypothetical protein [Marinobacter sp.]MCL1480665.1 hypothetical protein [Marinobacter sp.]MCL1484890.1 hypothetical protein [Marinobacter sp.]UQG56452.1 hypothetical protein MIH16_01875 [Marinobacter sp. M4C]UQG62351.1 hypothetical protein MIH18_10755 [Marinobacter sp. M3C]